MDIGQISTEKTTPALGWARRLLTRQLDALRRLAATAGRFAGSATRLAADPFVGALAVERAVKAHVKAAWVTRLIEALRLKLTGDLQRLDRGEAAPRPRSRSLARPLRPSPSRRLRRLRRRRPCLSPRSSPPTSKTSKRASPP